MSKTILIAGASSAIAQSSIIQLQQKNHTVIALSRQTLTIPGVECHQVEGYQPEQLPAIDQPLDGIVYFPGAINLKPFNRISLADFKTKWIFMPGER